MTRILFSLLAAVCLLHGQAAFPTSIATDVDLPPLVNDCETKLRITAGVNDSTIYVYDSSCMVPNMLLTLDYGTSRSEIVQVTRIAGTAVGVRRAQDGKTAQQHLQNASAKGLLTARSLNDIRDEIKAIEAALGAGLSNIPAAIFSDVRNFGAKAATTLTGTVSATGISVTGTGTSFTSALQVGDTVVIQGVDAPGTGLVQTAYYGYSDLSNPPYLRMGATVTGTGTAFTTQLQVGDEVTINGLTRVVTAIVSNTVMRVYPAIYPQATSLTAFTWRRRPSFATVSAIASNTSLTLSSYDTSYPAGSKIRKAPDSMTAFTSAFGSSNSHVVVPAGDYFLLQPDSPGQTILDSITNLKIEFQPGARIIFVRVDRFGFGFTNSSNLRISGFRYRHLRQPTALFLPGGITIDTYSSLGFNTVTDLVIEDLVIENSAGFGVQGRNVTRMQASNLNISNTARDGFTHEDCDQCVLSNATIQFTEDDCIGWHHVSGKPEGTNSSISNVSLKGCAGSAGIDVDGYRGVSVSNASIEGVFGSGIIAQNGNANQAPEAVFSNISIKNVYPADGTGIPSGFGMVFNNAKKVVVTGAQIENVYYHGILGGNGSTIADSSIILSGVHLLNIFGSSQPNFGGGNGVPIYLDVPGASVSLTGVDISRANYQPIVKNASSLQVNGGVWRDVGQVGSNSFFDFSGNGTVIVRNLALVDTTNPAIAYKMCESAINGYSLYAGITAVFLQSGRYLDATCLQAGAKLADINGAFRLALSSPDASKTTTLTVDNNGTTTLKGAGGDLEWRGSDNTRRYAFTDDGRYYLDGIKAPSGRYFVCIGSDGRLTSQSTACN